MSLGKLAVLFLAAVLAGGGIAAAFGERSSLPVTDAIQLDDEPVRKDDSGDVPLVQEDDDDDDTGDGDRTAGNDGTNGGDNTGGGGGGGGGDTGGGDT